MAFVHIQHLDPQHKSLMADLLQRSALGSLMPRYPDTKDQGIKTAGDNAEDQPARATDIQSLEVAEVLRDRFRRTGKTPIRLNIDFVNFAAEAFEQMRWCQESSRRYLRVG